MWMEERQNGYVFIEKYKDPVTGKWKRVSVTRHAKSNAAKAEARRALDRKIEEIFAKAGIFKDARLADVADAFIADISLTLKKQTVIGYRSYLNVIVGRIGPHTRLEALTAPYVRQALMDKPVTYNGRIKRFKRLMRWAYTQGYIADISWTDRLEKLPVDPFRIKNAEKYLEHDEIISVLGAIKPEAYRLLTEFLILSGLRIGEAIGLEMSDIGDTISINKTYSERIAGVSSTKTAASAREVFIQDELAACLHRIRKWRLEHLFSNGLRSDLLFPGRNGGYLCYPYANDLFRKATRETIGRELTIHATRHTHVAMLAEAGLSLDQIARRVGHSDSQVTREVYLHVTEKMKDKENELIRKVRII